MSVQGASDLEKLIMHYPERMWNWPFLSRNPNVSLEFIKAHPAFPWDWRIVANPNVTWYDIITMPLIWWNLTGQDYENDITKWEFTRPNAWTNLSSIVPLDIILDNPKLRWDWDQVSGRVNDKIILENPKIPWDDIEEYVSWEYIKSHPKSCCDWEVIGYNKNITPQIITDNPDYPWEFTSLSENPNLTWEFILKHHRELPPTRSPWDWSMLSLHPAVTWKIFRNNPDKRWYWPNIQKNPNVTLDIIKSEPELPWNYGMLSGNPNITFDFVQKIGIDKFNMESLSMNEFGWIAKKHAYKHITKIVQSLCLLVNCHLPRYLVMEMLEDEQDFSLYELYHIL